MPASARPVSLSAVSLNSTKATATIGMITIEKKKTRSHVRKLIYRPTSQAAYLSAICAHVTRGEGCHAASMGPLPPRRAARGAIAQLGERLDRTQEVAGSSPASSMQKSLLALWRGGCTVGAWPGSAPPA